MQHSIAPNVLPNNGSNGNNVDHICRIGNMDEPINPINPTMWIFVQYWNQDQIYLSLRTVYSLRSLLAHCSHGRCCFSDRQVLLKLEGQIWWSACQYVIQGQKVYCLGSYYGGQLWRMGPRCFDILAWSLGWQWSMGDCNHVPHTESI